MSEKSYRLPAIAWLKVTDYMLGWLQYELGGEARVKDMKVVCVQHLPGARDVLRMETDDELPRSGTPCNAMSATWRNAIDAGMKIDPAGIEREYGVTKELLRLYVPIECPRMCLTRNGVLRPWTLDTVFGERQTSALQRLLREAFWKAVGDFARGYAEKRKGEKYAQVEMIEAFCQETKTPELYVDAIRREWQRRVKRSLSPTLPKEGGSSSPQ